VVLYDMSERKCIYTNKSSKAKDSVIPKKSLKNEIYNWCNDAPCSLEYKDFKGDRMPTEDEILANELFKILELTKIRVRYYEEKLTEVQKRLIASMPEKPKKEGKKIKKEIEQAIHDVEVVQKIELDLNKELKDRKNSKMWE